MSSNTKLLVVLGATGLQGGSVARVFSELEPEWRVRGITRNPDSSAAQSLKLSGVEIVKGDMDDTSSLEAAFSGADAIFGVTDFWQFLKPGAATFAEAAEKGITANRLAMAKEIQHGKNIIDAAAKAHAKKSLHRFVLSTLSNSEKWSNGKIKNNLHFDGKAKFAEYLRERYPELAAVTNYLQIGYYLTNVFTVPTRSVRKVSDKEFILPTGVVENGKPIPYLEVANDTGHFVRALTVSPKSPPGTTIVGGSQNLTFEEYAELWGSVLGVNAKVERLSFESLVEGGAPEWLALEVDDSAKYISTYGWDGGEPGVKTPEEAGVDLSKLSDVASWIREQDWSSVGIYNKA